MSQRERNYQVTESDIKEISQHLIEVRVEMADISRRVQTLESLPQKVDALRDQFLLHPQLCMENFERKFATKEELVIVKRLVYGGAALILTLFGTAVANQIIAG